MISNTLKLDKKLVQESLFVCLERNLSALAYALDILIDHPVPRISDLFQRVESVRRFQKQNKTKLGTPFFLCTLSRLTRNEPLNYCS